MHSPYTSTSLTSTIVPVSNVFVPPTVITGRALGHKLGGLSTSQRAIIGATYLDGALVIKNPTIGQIAAICGVSRSTLNHARGLSMGERILVGYGERPLVRPQDQMIKSARKHHYTAADVMQVVDAFGADIVMHALDTLTMPEAAE